MTQTWPTKEELFDLLGIVMLGQYVMAAGMYKPTSGHDAAKARDSLNHWEKKLKEAIAQQAVDEAKEGR